jgi:adenosylcobinamide-phosphate synthase
VSPPHQDQFHLINKEPNHIDIIWIGFIGNQIIKEDMNIIVTFLIYAIPLAFAMRAIILAFALIIDAIIGEPDILWRYLPHPVVLFGQMINIFSTSWCSSRATGYGRRIYGVIAIFLLVVIAALIGAGLAALGRIAGECIQDGLWGGLSGGLSGELWPVIILEAVIVTILLAGRSLDQHVRQVANALTNAATDDDLTAARHAVSMIVGRNPDQLDAPAICRASIETTAENLSDGVVAPACYYLLFGLPGIIVYKMINTADSMIGYKSARWLAFGWGAARLDDLANLIPARLTGGLIILAAILPRPYIAWRAMRIMWRDAGYHRSPNAGWPEAAMAGALNIGLAGPRKYGARMSTDAPLNPAGRIADQKDIYAALGYLWRVTVIMIMGLLAIGLWHISW